MTDDLLTRLRATTVWKEYADGSKVTQIRNPDGAEAADRIEAMTAENERLRNDHASAVAELNKTKALLKGYRRGYKTARAALEGKQ